MLRTALVILSVFMLSVFMLSVFMLSVFMLSVFMLSVFMLSAVAPQNNPQFFLFSNQGGSGDSTPRYSELL